MNLQILWFFILDDDKANSVERKKLFNHAFLSFGSSSFFFCHTESESEKKAQLKLRGKKKEEKKNEIAMRKEKCFQLL
jgi:hypothetical protein